MSPWLLLFLLPFPVCWVLAFRFIFRDLHEETEVDVDPLDIAFAGLAAFIFTWLWPIALFAGLAYIPLKPFARWLVDVESPKPEPVQPDEPDERMEQALSRLYLQQLALRRFQLFPVEWLTVPEVARWMGVPEHLAERTMDDMARSGVLTVDEDLQRWSLSGNARKDAIAHPVIDPNLR